MTVGELRRRMSSREMTQWRAWFRLRARERSEAASSSGAPSGDDLLRLASANMPARMRRRLPG